MDYPKMQGLNFSEKKALVRVDFNVPLTPSGEVADDTRIRESLPTLQAILKQQGSIILLSHLGRPQGKKNPAYSLEPCAKALKKLLQRPVCFAKDCLGQQETCKALSPGDILLLENLRFYPAEEDPSLDPGFAQHLASYGDLYVNDAFGSAHRAHSSTASIAKYFPDKKGAGLLMQKEITALNTLLMHPNKPFHVLLGGAKISSKIGVLQSLLSKADAFFIGGAMAFTFFQAQGLSTGDSLVEKNCIETAKQFIDCCQKKNIPLYLPSDIRIVSEKSCEIKLISPSQGIPAGWKGMDIGPNTLADWEPKLQTAGTIFWNGPMGVFEQESFAQGTYGLARFLSTLSSTRIIGGGDSVAAINHLHIDQKFSHICTGGGAALEYIEFGHLPGIDALYN